MGGYESCVRTTMYEPPSQDKSSHGDERPMAHGRLCAPAARSVCTSETARAPPDDSAKTPMRRGGTDERNGSMPATQARAGGVHGRRGRRLLISARGGLDCVGARRYGPGEMEEATEGGMEEGRKGTEEGV